MTLGTTLRFIREHPLNSSRPLAAYARFCSWQLKSRILPGPFTIPFVDSARLVIDRGMTGLTGNIYCGLHEFEEMAFTMHFLQPGELFVDAGANAGSYTVLAAAVAGGRVVACEPDPDSRRGLVRNIAANGCEDRVEIAVSALGDHEGRVMFSIGRDTVNHVLAEDETAAGREVPLQTLDAMLDGRVPALIKIDVEGFEPEVVAGADRTLSDPRLEALIIEILPAEARAGRDHNDVARRIEANGFERVCYVPSVRDFRSDARPVIAAHGNVIFVRNRETALARVRIAPSRRIHATDTLL